MAHSITDSRKQRFLYRNTELLSTNSTSLKWEALPAGGPDFLFKGAYRNDSLIQANKDKR